MEMGRKGDSEWMKKAHLLESTETWVQVNLWAVNPKLAFPCLTACNVCGFEEGWGFVG